MPVLKNKIQKTRIKDEINNNLKAPPNPKKPSRKQRKLRLKPQPKGKSSKRNTIIGLPITPLKVLEGKNIVKNYARAIWNFIMSKSAEIHIKDLIETNNYDTNPEKFSKFTVDNKNCYESITNFKRILTVGNTESPDIQMSKYIFKQLAEIFVKYFSVNWIFSGRLQHRQTHLNARFIILRRIRDPELLENLKPLKRC
jgi:hypothetical protein